MNESGKEKQITIYRYFFGIFLVAGSMIAGTTAILYNFETKDYLSRLKIEEQINVNLQAEIITHYLDDIISDVKFLSRQNELSQLLESTDARYTTEIAREYLVFSQQKTKYDQIRLINEMGMETVRVNYNNGKPVIISESDLKSKRDRYYFKETMSLSHNEIFVSPLDLNIENGEIEKPLKPMIRFAAPVFNSANKKKGIVILNYFGGRLITSFKEAGQLSVGDIMLVNSDGYWLSGPQERDEWGFMIENRKDRKFSLDFPESWDVIVSSDNCQFANEKGLFTAATVYPLQERVKSSSSKINSDSDSRVNSAYYWKIISHIPQQRLSLGTRGLQVKLFLLAFSLLLFAAILAWVIAQSIVRRKQLQLTLYRSANYDNLSNLPNRSMFMDRLAQTLMQSKRYERKFALFFIDLDGFKSVNDTLGHNAGDKLLIEAAQRLLSCARESDTVARLGGDEFTVIFSTIVSLTDAKIGARKMIEELSVPFNIDGHNIQIGASIGVSVYPYNGENAESLLNKADNAMYLAKNEGKNDFRLSAL